MSNVIQFPAVKAVSGDSALSCTTAEQAREAERQNGQVSGRQQKRIVLGGLSIS